MKDLLRSLDVVTFGLLIVGGLNWGLMGFFGFDLVATIFGEISFMSRAVYGLVGIAALYELSQAAFLRERWTHAASH